MFDGKIDYKLDIWRKYIYICTYIIIEVCDAYFQTIFPRLDVVKLLLDCGAYVDARNIMRSTPLHVASNAYNFRNPVSIFLYTFIFYIEFYINQT